VILNKDDERWQRFLAAANDCCEMIETSDANDTLKNCTQLHRQLLELQSAALDLPESQANTVEPAIVAEAKIADRGRIKKAFNFRYHMPEQVLQVDLLAQNDMRSISEDIADVYEALQEILALNDANYIDDAVWQARGGYVEDWGYCVVSVQAGLWKYLAEAAIDAEERAEPAP
jgi:hypothetical protein